VGPEKTLVVHVDPPFVVTRNWPPRWPVPTASQSVAEEHVTDVRDATAVITCVVQRAPPLLVDSTTPPVGPVPTATQ
jgi:hypothetical protein